MLSLQSLHVAFKRKWRKMEGSLAEADLMACSLLIISVITRESLGIISRRTQLRLFQEIAHKHAYLNLDHLMCSIIIINRNVQNRLQAGSLGLLCLRYLTPLQQHAPHIITHLYLVGQMDMLISLLVSVMACVCTPVSHDSLEYVCELLLKVTGGQANLETNNGAAVLAINWFILLYTVSYITLVFSLLVNIFCHWKTVVGKR